MKTVPNIHSPFTLQLKALFSLLHVQPLGRFAGPRRHALGVGVEGGPAEEDDDDEVRELAAPSCALTSTPHDIAERAAAAVRLDRMRKSRDAALKDREDLQEFVKELQEKLEESRRKG